MPLMTTLRSIFSAAAEPISVPTTCALSPAALSSSAARSASGPASEIGMRWASSVMPPPVMTPSTNRTPGSAAATCSLSSGAVELRST